jgi:osmotically-inducible protein OsmY
MLFAAITVSVAFAWGQVRAPRPPISSTNTPTVSDTELEKSIREKFAKSKISTNNFQVRVYSGVAILEGRTGVPQHKGTATRLARKAGARRVDNRIQVGQTKTDRGSDQPRSEPRRVQVTRSDSR